MGSPEDSVAVQLSPPDIPPSRVWTENSPQDNPRVEYQEVTAELLLNLLEMNEEVVTATDSVAASESLPVIGTDTAPSNELVSSTAEETPAESEPEREAAEFDSDDDQALLDCVNLDNKAENIFNRVGNSTPIYVTTSMWSHIVNYPLSRMLQNMRISVKKLFALNDKEDLGEIYGKIEYQGWHTGEVAY